MTWRQRLADLIKADGRKPAEIQRAAGVNSTALRDILERGQTPSVDQLSRIARALHTTLAKLYDGEQDIDLAISVSGVTSGETGVWSEVSRGKVRLLPLDIFEADHVSIEVRGDDLCPEYRDGDVLTGRKVHGPHLDNYIGNECIVETADNKRLIGVLLRGVGVGKFSVRPFKRAAEEHRDVRIRWAAPIELIIRAKAH